MNEEFDVPAKDLYVAADLHNIGNSGTSWYNPLNFPKFAISAVASGVTQLVNSGLTIGRMAGIDSTDVDTKNILTSLDEDLGQYYDQNRQSADLVGFIASSFIPGIAGIKVLNAGQKALAAAEAGNIGANISRATGLLVPKTANYVEAAAKEINASQATFSMLNQNTLKALASGVQQNVLESVAFETAVQATMFSSPILKQQDAGDIAKNLIYGGLVGGAIGGAIEGAISLGKISSKVKAFEAETKYTSAIASIQEMNSPYRRIILHADEKEMSTGLINPHLDAADEFYAVKQQNLSDKVERLNNAVRTDINAMAAESDLTVTNILADAQLKMTAQQTAEAFMFTQEIARAGVTTKIEKALKKAIEAKDGDLAAQLKISYVNLATGKVSEAPGVLNLADKVLLKSGQSLEEAVRTLVKREGFRKDALFDVLDYTNKTGHYTVEARYIWANSIKLPEENFFIHMNDIPMLERAVKEGRTDLKLVDSKGQTVQDGFPSLAQMENYLFKAKEELAGQLNKALNKRHKDSVELNAEVAAKMVNTRLDRLDGTKMVEETMDYYANAGKEFTPTYAKIARNVTEKVNPHLPDQLAYIKEKEKLFEMAVDNVIATSAPSIVGKVRRIPEALLWQANKIGGHAGIFTFAKGNFGTLEAEMMAHGNITHKLIKDTKQLTTDAMTSPLVNLANNQAAAIEFHRLNQEMTRSGKLWKLFEGDLKDFYLVERSAKEKLLEGRVDMDELVDAGLAKLIEHAETAAVFNAGLERTGTRLYAKQNLRAAQGFKDEVDSQVIRPIRPNPRDYKHFAFVIDEKVTNSGHKTMIFAATEEKLAELAAKTEQAGYKVIFKQQTEDFHAAVGDYEYARTLHENAIDSTLSNRGIMSEFYTKTDPQKIVDDVIRQHYREDETIARELMRGYNQKAFDFLEDQAKAYSKISSSTLGYTSAEALEKASKNPYLSYIKTALDISGVDQSSLLWSANRKLDQAVSSAVEAVRDTYNSTKVFDAEKTNALLDKYGMNTGYRDAALDLLVNHSAPKGELTKFVRGANTVLAHLTLGLDPLNALNNAIGANVLRGTELKSLTEAIKAGDTKIAGKLGELMKVTLPEVGDKITAPSKLVASSIKRFFDPAIRAEYREAGFIKNISEQFHDMLEDLTLKGTESVSALQGKLRKAEAKAAELAEAGQKYTGNKLAEEFNRFVAADVMRQITDAAQEAGLLSKAEAYSYINTFVNRVEANIIASQRPLVFSGPIGQAIGLFQSYQFNLMQQLFRHVAEGQKKDAAMLLGLQGTFYGLNGLPAFQFMNQHIIGTMGGNKDHTDAYDALYQGAGRKIGDLMLYGLPSNILQANLYSRGDINPRHVTVLPNTLADIPFVGAFGKFLGSVKETATKIGGGGAVWESMLQGLEHNGLNRPLAGLAQVLQGFGEGGKAYSTTNKGSILMSNDLFSWASAVRLVGGRPLDEAVVNDTIWRVQAYKQYDLDQRKKLSEAVRSASIQGNKPDEDSVLKFAKAYAESGGKQKDFNAFMIKQMKDVNTNEAERIVSQLQNPFAHKMQLLME